MITAEFINFIYLFAGVCFIMALRGLASPQSARMGNKLGIIGMLAAIGITFYSHNFSHHAAVICAIVIAGIIGGYIAKKIPMTAMPQLVAGFHSFVGLAAVLVAYSALLSPESFGIGLKGQLHPGNLIEMSLGAAIGALTFTGSIIAFGKLQGLIPSKPLKFIGQQYFAFALLAAIIIAIVYFARLESVSLFNLIVFGSLVFGVLLIAPVGGADMPVIVSMLNSYSGWAAAGIGFTLGNSLLIITGALVGSSGAILSFVMCKAMN
ncbi:MAG: NAD(p) transhydrogenase subunit beta, partial [Pseudomonadota bacterium]